MIEVISNNENANLHKRTTYHDEEECFLGITGCWDDSRFNRCSERSMASPENGLNCSQKLVAHSQDDLVHGSEVFLRYHVGSIRTLNRIFG